MLCIATYESILGKLSADKLWVVSLPECSVCGPAPAPCVTTPEGEKAYSTLGVQWDALKQAWESDTPGASPDLSTLAVRFWPSY